MDNNRPRIARRAAMFCMAGATLQIVYGLLAVLFPYPAITEPGFEMLWALANVGMAGGVIGWLALDAARPRWAAIMGSALAVLGYLIRIVVSIVLIVNQDAAVDAPIVASILLTFGGIGILGITSLRAKQPTGGRAWAPLLTVAAGLVAASFYSTNKVIHFILLGLLWGPTWILISILVLNTAGKRIRDAHPTNSASEQQV